MTSFNGAKHHLSPGEIVIRGEADVVLGFDFHK